jgi:hypothetical protein
MIGEKKFKLRIANGIVGYIQKYFNHKIPMDSKRSFDATHY